MTRKLTLTAITAAGASLARLCRSRPTSPRLSGFPLPRGRVMTPALRPASLPVLITSLLALAGLLALLAWPTLVQSDTTAPSNLTAEIVQGGVLLDWDAPQRERRRRDRLPDPPPEPQRGRRWRLHHH